MKCPKCKGTGKLPDKDPFVTYYDHKLDKTVRCKLSEVPGYHWERANQIAKELRNT